MGTRKARGPALARWTRRGACALLAATAGLAVGPTAADEPVPSEAGVELVGRSPDDRAPSWWTLVDVGTQAAVARVEGRWGFVPVAPGEYVLRVRPYGHEAVEVAWGKVAVAEGRPTRVELRSGVDLRGRGTDDEVLHSWDVVDQRTGDVVAHTWQRWGFTPLPSGSYAVRIRPVGYQALELPWVDAVVEEGAVVSVAVDSGLELAGLAGAEAPHWWYVHDAASGARVAAVYQRWGRTPLRPGEYDVRIVPIGYQAVEIPWSRVVVGAGEVATVAVDSGVRLAGRPGDDPPKWWIAQDAKTGERAAAVYQRWGYTPLRPGEYEIRIDPGGYEAVEVPWSRVTVPPAGVADVAVDSGIEAAGRPGDDPPQWWTVHDASSGERVAAVYQRWGRTPVRPGTYDVRVVPYGHGALEVPWERVTVAPGQSARVAVTSGVEMRPRDEGEAAPREWSVLDRASGKPVAVVRDRWGMTPLPPGAYAVQRMPFRWEADVAEGEVVRLTEPDFESQWRWATGAGRRMERETDPEGWKRLEEQIEQAIRRAAAWLKRQPEVTGMDPERSHDVPTLAILALVHAGELERDPALARRCVDYLLRRALNGGHGTYANALVAMALRDLSAVRYRARIRECAEWLVENQGWDGERKVWGYGDPVPGYERPRPPGAGRGARPPPGTADVVRRGLIAEPSGGWDNSNAQFAVLGLHSAAQARVGIPRRSWERVEEHFRESQDPSGGWGYGHGSPYGSMTCAGVASLLVARFHLGAERPSYDPAVVRGLGWLAWTFTVEENPASNSNHHYYLYGLERVGVLAGTEFIGDREWYPLGARHLLGTQAADGSWASPASPPSGGPRDVLDTCYAILFLRRATLPLQAEKAPGALRVVAAEDGLPPELAPAVELILDSSHSMKDPIDGKPKIEIARAVVADLLENLPADVHVGLRLYGHWGVWVLRRDDPKAPALDPNDPRLKTDSQLVVPIGPLDEARRAALRKWIAFAQPRGMTPMVYSLLQARHDFRSGGKAPRAVVLVSDGEETGGGKIEDVAAAYRGSGIDVVIHVVGFDIREGGARAQLEAIARAGKGRYYGARNAGELSEALRAAVRGYAFEVRDATGATVVAQGPLGGDPVELEPGTFRVGILGAAVEPLPVTVAEGQEVTVRLETTGRLVVVPP